MSSFSRLAPWLTAIFGLAMMVSPAFRSPYRGSTDLSEFARLPVVDGGRVKPLDTVARTNLMIISSKASYDRDDDSKGRPATEWLLDVMASQDPFTSDIAKWKIFRIESLELLNLLKLDPRPGSYRYSLSEIGKNYEALKKELKRADDRDSKSRDLYDQKLLELGKHLQAFEQLATHRGPLVVPPPDSKSENWLSLAEIDAEIAKPFREAAEQQAIERVAKMLKDDNVDLEKLGPDARRQARALIERISEQLLSGVIESKRAETNPRAAAFASILEARREKDASKFAESVEKYRQVVSASLSDREIRKARLEVMFNNTAPFYTCLMMYVLAFLLAAASWMGFSAPLQRSALSLIATTFVVHTAALLVRMYLLDRPLVFVTNLYSSAVFIGWGCVLLGLVVELIFGRGLGSAVAGATGFASLLIAHFLGMDGDTLQMMQAVLDTNFWLATHVTVVTFGYAATYFAGFFAIAYILAAVVTNTLKPEVSRTLSQVIYGIVCFATLASFLGTVLGGIWADQSWGRFWGWDPKENGALLIVIWNALILHARWAGMVKARGIAVLAVLGNIVTTWSWFGTNQLGVGLHSYGFTSGMSQAIFWSSLAFFGIAVLGMLPERFWAAVGLRRDLTQPTAKASTATRLGKAQPAKV